MSDGLYYEQKPDKAHFQLLLDHKDDPERKRFNTAVEELAEQSNFEILLSQLAHDAETIIRMAEAQSDTDKRLRLYSRGEGVRHVVREILKIVCKPLTTPKDVQG